MIVRELLTRIGYDVDPKAEQRAKNGFTRVRDAAAKLGLALSAGAVAIGFKKTLDAASDVEETMNVITTAFEDQAGAVLEWARVSGEAAGRSEFAMREYAATVGAIVGPTLGSAEATAALSQDMAQLAVDLGSFFNATDEEALQALRAGLIGSQEPLQRFGVNMSVAALNTFAQSRGIKKQVKDMTAAEKTMLRYRFIMARTTKAQGDAEKTSDGFANQVKRLQGNIRNIAVAIGRELLPGAASLLKSLNGLAKTMAGPLVSALRLITAPFKLLGAIVIGLGFGFMELGTAGKVAVLSLIPAFTAWLVIMGKISVAQLLVFGQWVLIGVGILLLILIVEDLWQAITGGNSVIGNLFREFGLQIEEAGGWLGALKEIFKTAFDFFVEKIFGVEDATDKVVQALVRAWAWLKDQAIAIFQSIYDFIVNGLVEAFGVISDKLAPFLDALSGPLVSLFGAGADLNKRFGLGLGDIAGNLGLAGPSSLAVPGSAAALNSSQQINIDISAPGGDPQAIAGAVAPAVGRAAAEGNRRTAQQLLNGGAS